MYKKIKALFIFMLMLLGIEFSLAQNNTDSPYSRIAYGHLNDPGFSMNKSMGGIGIGLRSKNTINPANPASYTETDSTSFKFEVAAFVKWSSFTDNNANESKKINGNLDHVALSVPLGKHFALSGGLMAYSDMGYNVQLEDSIDYLEMDGKLKRIEAFNGSGGLNSVYIGLAGTFLKRVSIGFNAKYIFGSLKKQQTYTFPNNANFSASFSNSLLRINAFDCDFGLQYQEVFAGKHKIVIGGIYSPKLKMGADYEEYTPIDTVIEKSSKLFESPQSYGVGFTYAYEEKFTIGFDYKKEEWSNAYYRGEREFLKDRTKYSFGAEYVNDPNSLSYWKRVRFRLGGNIYSSYYDYAGKSVNGFGMTFGVGLPIRQSRTALNVIFEYNRNGNLKVNPLKEDIFKLTINASINENWFYKRRFN